MPKVYLAGPIAGLTFEGCTNWRNEVAEMLLPYIDGFSPMRAKEYFKGQGVISKNAYTQTLSSDRGILTRDHWDCMTADLIFVNLLGAQSISQGTVMEIAFGHAYRKPIVCVMEPKGNLHDHPMIRQAIDFRFEDIKSAVEVTKAILLPCHGAPRVSCSR